MRVTFFTPPPRRAAAAASPAAPVAREARIGVGRARPARIVDAAIPPSVRTGHMAAGVEHYAAAIIAEVSR
jgi:hypothetical protein